MITQIRRRFKFCVWRLFFVVISTKDFSQAENDQPNSLSFTEGKLPSYLFHHQTEYPRDCVEVLGRCSSANSSGVYAIKPDGYPEVFDVYCDSDGYTVIERRFNGIISFNRSWADFTSGFGFLSHEFWLGNHRLSYLTNQKRYLLSIDITLRNGSTFSVKYNEFRISDASSNYRLISTGQFSDDGGWSFWGPCSVTCGEGVSRRYRRCTDGATCVGDNVEAVVCHEEECILDGGWSDWSEWEECPVSCGGGLQVRERECNNPVPQHGGQDCTGNSQQNRQCGTAQCPAISDCKDVYDSGQTSSGLYYLNPGWSQSRFQVYCNMTDGGGWTVIQRQDGSGDFYHNWAAYKNGFGSLNQGMWLGNEKIHQLTNQKIYELRIDLTNRDGNRYYAIYSSFRVDGESDKYKLSSVGSYSGNAGNSMSWHVNKPFSTHDRDNDGSNFNCAEQHRGGWWFSLYDGLCSVCDDDIYCAYFPDTSGGRLCGFNHLNADHDSATRGRNIFWYGSPGYDCGIQYTEMKIRPVQS